MKISKITREALKPMKFLRTGAIGACMFCEIFGMLSPYFLGKLLDNANSKKETVITLSCIVLFLLVMEALINWIQNFLWFKMIFRGIYLLRVRLFSEVMKQDVEYITKTQSGDIVNRLLNDSAVYVEKVLISIPMLLINVTTLAVVFVIIGRFQIYISLALLFISVLYFISYRAMNKKMREHAKRSGEDASELLHKTTRFYEGIPTIKLFRRELFFNRKFEECAMKRYRSSVGMRNWQSLAQAFVTLLTGLLPVLAIILGIYFVAMGKCTFGAVFSIFTYTGYINEPIRNLTDFNIAVQNGKSMEERLEILLRQGEEKKAGRKLSGIHAVEFKGVSFFCENGTGVENIDFSLKKGDRLAITGASGAGKSTCLKLLLGQMKPSEGKVLVNGEQLTDEILDSYLEQLSVLPQNIFLYEDSIMENIIFGREKGGEDIEKIRDTLELNSFLDREIAELSGGERKRIGLSRALYDFENVLILDEPTAEVDMKMEQKMICLIDEFAAKKNGILIVVTHQPAILGICNKRLELKNGMELSGSVGKA